MAVKSITMPKKTLKELHGEAKDSWKKQQQAILEATGTKGVASYYDIIHGNRSLSPAEKRAVAEIFRLNVEEIDWQDEKNLPETGTKA